MAILIMVVMTVLLALVQLMITVHDMIINNDFPNSVVLFGDVRRRVVSASMINQSFSLLRQSKRRLLVNRCKQFPALKSD